MAALDEALEVVESQKNAISALLLPDFYTTNP